MRQMIGTYINHMLFLIAEFNLSWLYDNAEVLKK